jgi:hypothetical protein
MIISTTELHQIQHASKMAGVEAALDQVCDQLPHMLDEAVKVAMAAKAKRPTRPTYPGRSERKARSVH